MFSEKQHTLLDHIAAGTQRSKRRKFLPQTLLIRDLYISNSAIEHCFLKKASMSPRAVQGPPRGRATLGACTPQTTSTHTAPAPKAQSSYQGVPNSSCCISMLPPPGKATLSLPQGRRLRRENEGLGVAVWKKNTPKLREVLLLSFFFPQKVITLSFPSWQGAVALQGARQGRFLTHCHPLIAAFTMHFPPPPPSPPAACSPCLRLKTAATEGLRPVGAGKRKKLGASG